MTTNTASATDTRPRVAITMGDPAGVGPELCVRALADSRVLSACVPIVFGNSNLLRHVADRLSAPIEFNTFEPGDQSFGRCRVPACVDFPNIDFDQVQCGHVNRHTGAASYQYVTAAIEAALDGHVDAIATGPIHKEAFHAAGVPYPGHTELLAAQTKCERSCMMLTSDEITCSFVTSHIGLRDVADSLTTARILEVIELSHQALLQMRGCPPKLVVCGLNPHAGEHGLFGAGEEERTIAPAIEQARKQGIQITGPLPPDTAFVPSIRATTDCYICMYHDQGLIPLKMLAFDTAVNVTLGLPIVRTSVDHGTALDIAWQGKADITSMVNAILLAASINSKRTKS